MALNAICDRTAFASSSTRKPMINKCSSMRSVSCRSTSTSSVSSSGVLQQLPAQLATAALAATLLLAPVGAAQAAQPQQLADLLREEYAFLDKNGDGVVSRSEMQQFAKAMSGEQNLPMVPEDQLDFVIKLYDLNRDGRTTNEEVLRSLVLDAAVNEDNDVDADVFDIFDTNKNGTIEADEFRAGLGDLGSNGEAAKDYIFQRVDHVIGSGGKLPVGGFANALSLVRAATLGY